MSRRDFNAIARILAGEWATASASEKGKVYVITLSLADHFQSANPRFDRGRFYHAVFGTDQWGAQQALRK